MKLGLALLARLTLFRHRREQVDPHFAQRLQRIGAREGLRAVQAGPFRNPHARPAV
ncbi:hypothetical protein [Paragemmobacter straminiformis]|uniref:Uncharacterized protein n=1 Tax=Paragemmobacter straminiformis TaxID=2045119 RepID=A0A842I2N7_9RHOB|nr:hypothetical protein [Gemmobacter straminiformis]MBC2834200.1 hypothetical protein [Gemmobacter straminiformis]